MTMLQLFIGLLETANLPFTLSCKKEEASGLGRASSKAVSVKDYDWLLGPRTRALCRPNLSLPKIQIGTLAAREDPNLTQI